jgi:hypothetical protein
MDIEIDLERIRGEDAWWWLSKVMIAYYALKAVEDSMDSGLL